MSESRATYEDFREAIREAVSASQTAEAAANAATRAINGTPTEPGLKQVVTAHTTELTRLDHGRKINRLLAGIALLLALALLWGGLVLKGVVEDVRCGNDALKSRQNLGTVSAPINRVLGRDADTPVKDGDVTQALYRLINAAPDAYSRDEKRALAKEMGRVTDANQEYRERHPIGACD